MQVSRHLWFFPNSTLTAVGSNYPTDSNYLTLPCRTSFIPYDLLIYDLLLLRSISHTNICPYKYNVGTLSRTTFWRTIFGSYGLFHLRTFARKNIITYELYPVRSFGVRSFALTNICRYEYYTVRTLIPYDRLACELFL